MNLTNEQKVAVERQRRVASGERIGVVYGRGLISFHQDLLRCRDVLLAEHPADDDEPITGEWWIRVGFELERSPGDVPSEVFHHKESGLKFWDWNGQHWICDALDQGGINREFRRRGCVRLLCRALVIELNEQR